MGECDEAADERRAVLRGFGHEIDNDLSAIVLFVDVLRNEAATLASGDPRRFLEALDRALNQIDRAAERATRAVHDLIADELGRARDNGHAPDPAPPRAPGKPEIAPWPLPREIPGSASAGTGEGNCYARVLCVEDNPSSAKLVERLLGHRAGIELVVAAKGADALEIATREAFDLVLLDLNLPDIAGEELLGRLRGARPGATTPVVVLSAEATAARVADLRAAGAAGYLAKPFNLEEFYAMIDALCPPPSRP